MTIRQVCTYGTKVPRDEREMLLAFVLKKSREYTLSHDTEHISLWSFFRYLRLVKQREAGIPYSYLVHEAWFYGRRFLVNRHTLIPRPETEHLIEQALLFVQKQPVHLAIDVGTGSGCIPITLARELFGKSTTHFFAVDRSKRALQVAKKNAKFHEVSVEFLHGHLLEPIEHLLQKAMAAETPILITANLPYLTLEEYKDEPSIQHEPKMALVAPDQGLGLYLELIKSLIAIPDRKAAVLLLIEMNDWQFPILEKRLDEITYRALRLNTICDLRGQPRIAEITIPPLLL